MDLEKRSAEEKNRKMYMDLKDIVKEHTLPFLPAKSLVKFSTVCGDWNRWILSPFLARNQSYSFHAVSGLFCQSHGAKPSFVSLDPSCYGVPDPSLEFLQVPIDIKTSSKGLICCQTRTGDKEYYICNPVTKQSRILPKPNCHHGENPAIVLVFEPSLLSFAANYKLVCAFPSEDFDDGHEFEMYSSQTGSWKLSGEICFGRRKLVPESGVHVKGVVYWMSSNYIIAFDLAKDRSRLIDSFSCSFDKGCLGEMNGELCYIKVSKHSIVVRTLSNAYSNTMEMSNHYGMWTQKHRIALNDVLEEKILSMQKPVLLFGDGNVLVVQVGEDTVVSYDLKTKQTAVLSVPLRLVKGRSVPYVNSLVSLV